MPSRFSTLILVCEDLQQRCFMYQYVVRRGVCARSVRVEQSPKGRGDAKQFVRDRHVMEARALRSKPHLSGLGLVTVMDADEASVAERKRELDDALTASGQGKRSASERIAVLVPRRNIETWVHHLLGTTVNEDEEYPRFRQEERKCAPAVQVFVDRCPSHMTDDDPPSLRDGCDELTRFFATRQG